MKNKSNQIESLNLYSGEPGNNSDMNQTEKIRRLQDAARYRVEGIDGSKVGGGGEGLMMFLVEIKTCFTSKTLSQAFLLAS